MVLPIPQAPPLEFSGRHLLEPKDPFGGSLQFAPEHNYYLEVRYGWTQGTVAKQYRRFLSETAQGIVGELALQGKQISRGAEPEEKKEKPGFKGNETTLKRTGSVRGRKKPAPAPVPSGLAKAAAARLASREKAAANVRDGGITRSGGVEKTLRRSSRKTSTSPTERQFPWMR